MFDLIAQALINALKPDVLIWNLIGVAAGIAVGCIPGLSATMAVAILVPFTFGLEPLQGISMLLGIYTGTMLGVGIPACLLRIPGNPSGIMTVRDGYPMAKRGEAGKAIGYVAYSSAIGGFLGIIVLIGLAQLISKNALRFGPAEMFAVAIWGLASVSDLTGDDLIKGVVSGLLGLLIGVIGLDTVTGIPRLTFGITNLLNGVEFIPIMIGLFGMAEIMRQLKSRGQFDVKVVHKIGGLILSIKDMLKTLPTVLRASFIGMWVGILPGATGGAMASILAYEYERKRDPHPERFGQGAPEGICASEAANNAVIGGNLVPLLTLGVPGDTVTAVLIGAFMIHGLQPGPLLFKNTPDLVYAIYVALLIANAFMFIIGILGARFFARIISLPLNKLIPIIALLCVTGTYSVNNSLFDVAVMLIFGLVGYVMDAIKMPIPPMIMGIVLGPMAEYNFRTAMKTFQNDWTIFFTRPYVLFFWILIVLMIAVPRINWRQLFARKQKEHSGSALQ